MIQSLADLYVLAQTVDQDTNAIFIAKDHLVASGAPSLAQVASKFKIPLITSDNGSVIAGAAVAIGNKESDIGRRGGEIAIQLLEGAKPKDIPMLPLSTYTVFVNGEAIQKQGLTLEKIQIAARTLGHPLEMVQQ
jgi:putative ABC transport system substrate-binding protein